MSKIIGLVVTRNEANRYLRLCLQHHMHICDEIVVYDDQSTDQTVKVAENHGCRVEVRPDSVPAFLENESGFRQAAWNYLGSIATADDGILVFDADEFLTVKDHGDVHDEVVAVLARTDRDMGIAIPIAEVFGFTNDGTPMVRSDGYWGNINGVRLVCYKSGIFRNQELGCGAVPGEFMESISYHAGRLSFLHLGYANWEDRVIKYDRYKGREGHSISHVASIMKEPTLRKEIVPIYNHDHIIKRRGQVLNTEV